MSPPNGVGHDGPSCLILHDFLQVNGGAERLVLSLARHIDGAGLAVAGIYSGFTASGDLGGVAPRVLGPSWLPRVPRALFAFAAPGPLPQAADAVVYSGIYAPLAVQRQRHGRRIYYCHTPPRFAFDEEADYLGRASAPLRPLLRLAIGRYRAAYLRAIAAMDVVIANSAHIRDKLRRQLGVEARIIHPPVDLAAFTGGESQGYYVSVARLEPNKRVDRVVRAFLGMPQQRLVVASGGSQLPALRQLAAGAPNITFTGWVDDGRLRDLIGRSIGVIYIPRDEDFGMSAIEAMSAGKPVIGVKEGGLPESIVDGQTGRLLSADPTPNELMAAVEWLTPARAAVMEEACRARAEAFSLSRFLAAMRKLIDRP